MDKFDRFISIIRSFILKAIYVWGGQGEPTNEADIRAHETSVENANRAITLYRQRKAQGVNPVIKFDCSGLIVYVLMLLGLIGYDTTADGIYDRCKKIAKSALKLGDFCFRISNDGSAHHIGVVTRIEGGTVYVTESYGRSVGVVERALDATPGYWEAYGDNPFFADAEQVNSLISYESHVQYLGWVPSVSDGTISGTVGQRLRAEAIKVHLGVPGGIEYHAHVENDGWQYWVANGAVSGTVGEGKRLEAFEARVIGEAADKYDLYYRAHVQDIGWMDWVKNGETAGTTGQGRRLEALRIVLVPKGGQVPA